MYKEISVNNFRTLKKVHVGNFGDVNIITGGNGSGKSTLLEAIFLNAGGSHAGLALSLNALRGDDQLSTKNDAIFHSLFNNLDATKDISIDARYTMPNSRIVSRDLKITPRLEQKISKAETGVDVFVNGLDFKFATKPVRSKKEKISKGHVRFSDDTDGVPITNSKVDSSILLPCRFISPMAPTIQYMSDRITTVVKTKEIGQVVELLRIIDPRISSITSLSEGGRNQVYVDIGLKNLMPATYMGGGFIRLLNLAISMVADDIVLIDEIENGLHYSMHEPLLDFLFKASVRLNRQLFVTTHSSEFLDSFVRAMNAFDEVDVRAYRCVRHNGSVSITTYSEEELGLREQLDIELR